MKEKGLTKKRYDLLRLIHLCTLVFQTSCFKLFAHISNACLYDFVLFAYFSSYVTVNSLYSYFEWAVESFDDIESNNNVISRKNLVDHALELCHILKYEFILSPVSKVNLSVLPVNITDFVHHFHVCSLQSLNMPLLIPNRFRLCL